jgi:hypothetical protein
MNLTAQLEENCEKGNLFKIITAEVAAGDLSEFYLVAGQDFTASTNSPGIMRAIAATKAASPDSKASSLIIAHYQLGGVFGRHCMFEDGVREVLTHNNVAVQFEVKEISRKPHTYRVLFQRVDAEKLLTEVKEKLDDLNDRVRALELRPRWNANS